MKNVIGECPICGGDLVVSKLSCHHCDTEISGQFKLSKFNYLSKEHLYFIEMFMKNRGNIKALEKELGVSYPTVKKNLDEVIIALGYKVDEEEESIDRDEILNQLARGEISAKEAFKLLK
jgi:hypothetical protein